MIHSDSCKIRNIDRRITLEMNNLGPHRVVVVFADRVSYVFSHC